MKKYNSEDYFSVIDIRTGRKIVDCGEEADALAMVSFDSQNRTITRNKFIMGPVVDIEIPKALPTTNITTTNFQENEYTPREKHFLDAGLIRLPEGEGKPVIV